MEKRWTCPNCGEDWASPDAEVLLGDCAFCCECVDNILVRDKGIWESEEAYLLACNKIARKRFAKRMERACFGGSKEWDV